jgi:UDP-N-acetylglucosamine 2-epimerase (non-hydrolysing)
VLVHTGQHYDRMVNDVFFEELPLPTPHVQLEVGSGRHGAQTARALAALEETFLELQPDLVVVPGDINSTLAGALAAAKLQIPVCHLESGLRSFDWSMPEEHNRRVADVLSSLLLTHSEDANRNLAAEGVDPDRVRFVGNTMIDTLFATVGKARALEACREHGLSRRGYILVTLHRPALVDDPALLRRTMTALEAVAREIPILFPVHPRTAARLRDLGLDDRPSIVLAEPQPYAQFLSLEADAAGVVTDSGGVQEETTALGIPCLTLRDNTERPVTVTHGTNHVLGLDPERLAAIPRLIGTPRPHLVPPLWDGRAGARAADEIESFVAGAVELPAARVSQA